MLPMSCVEFYILGVRCHDEIMAGERDTIVSRGRSSRCIVAEKEFIFSAFASLNCLAVSHTCAISLYHYGVSETRPLAQILKPTKCGVLACHVTTKPRGGSSSGIR